MIERLTDEQLRRWAGPNHEGPHHDMAAELLALRARNVRLEAALLDCKRYAEDHDDEWVPFCVDDALLATS